MYALKVFVRGVELIKQLVSHAVRGALIQILRRDVGGITASHPRDLVLDVIGDRGLARCAPHLLAGPHLHRGSVRGDVGILYHQDIRCLGPCAVPGHTQQLHGKQEITDRGTGPKRAR